MIRRCYQCNKIFGEKEPLTSDEETHGLCPACLPAVMEDLQRQIDKFAADKQAVPLR